MLLFPWEFKGLLKKKAIRLLLDYFLLMILNILLYTISIYIGQDK